MTDRPAEQTSSNKPRKVDLVAVLAIALWAMVVSVIAWLVIWPEPDAPAGGGPPSITIALPPAAAALPPAMPSEPPASATAAAPAEPEAAPAESPAAIAPPINPSDIAAGGPKAPSVESAPALPAARSAPVAEAPPAARPSPPAPPSPGGETTAAIPPVPLIAPPPASAPPTGRPSTGGPPEAAPKLVMPTAPAPAPAQTESQAAPETASPPAAPVPDAPAQAAVPRPAIPPPPSFQPAQRPSPAPPADGLAPAPDPALIEPGSDGPLPVIGKDGRRPWQVYARPFDSGDSRPRVALIISGLGPSAAATEAAIQRLPGAITLAFVPYAKNLEQWMALSRESGHETLLSVPMEPISSETEPGPLTLLTSLSERDNRTRLLFQLSRATGYVGVLNSMGGRLTTSPQSLRPILAELKDRGLIFVDARSSPRSIAASQATAIGLPRAINNGFIDLKAARADIDSQLEALSQLARDSGYALGIASSYPVTIERVALWAEALDGQGIALAPVTALVDQQPD